jgi:dimethylargininase
LKLAITREVSPALARCELTHLSRRPIDPDLAREQHRRYEACLAAAGFTVRRLPAEPDLPDSVFVEDAAVVLDEVAILARPGAVSRRPEVPSIAEALRPYRTLVPIEAPATLDGGDILVVGRAIFAGASSRTSAEGIEALRGIAAPYGYEVRAVPVSRCLHLKSAVTRVSERAVLIHPGWVEPSYFSGLELIEIDPAEPFAANALAAGDTLIYPEAFPRTLARLEARGLRVVTVDVSELAKAEGAVTCCSLLFEVHGTPP